MDKKCQYCGERYILNPKYSKKQKAESKFCSRECQQSMERERVIFEIPQESREWDDTKWLPDNYSEDDTLVTMTIQNGQMQFNVKVKGNGLLIASDGTTELENTIVQEMIATARQEGYEKGKSEPNDIALAIEDWYCKSCDWGPSMSEVIEAICDEEIRVPCLSDDADDPSSHRGNTMYFGELIYLIQKETKRRERERILNSLRDSNRIMAKTLIKSGKTIKDVIDMSMDMAWNEGVFDEYLPEYRAYQEAIKNYE